jgi:hypothetical protein
VARDGRADGHSYPTRPSLLVAILPDEFLGWDLDPAAGGGVKRRGAFPKSGGPQGLFENGPVLRFRDAAVLGRSSLYACC